MTRNIDDTILTSLYRKPTFSGLYTKWESFLPKEYKRGLVNCLLTRAWKLCSNYEILDKEIKFIRTLLVANGYPATFLDNCIHRFLSNKMSPSPPVYGPEKKPIFISLPYCGLESVKLKRQLTRMFTAILPNLQLRIVFKPSWKISALSKLKSAIPILSLSNVVYKVTCTDCDSFYVGMTTRRLVQRMQEHSTNENGPLLKHASETGHSVDFTTPDVLATDSFKTRLYIKETLKIVDFCAFKSLNGNSGSFELKLW